MRHITDSRLDDLEPLLAQLRKLDALVEKKRGVFYRKSRAFLHFHEDPTGLFADVRLGGTEFDRYAVTKRSDQRQLVKRIEEVLA